jgi:hypothetical protein
MNQSKKLDFLISATFSKLPRHLRNQLTKEEVAFVLQKEEAYLQQAEADTINETAFQSVTEFLEKELRLYGLPVSNKVVQEILNLKAKIEAEV